MDGNFLEFAWNLGSCWLYPIASAKAIQVKAVCACNLGTTECEFSYRGDGYKKRVREMVSAWSYTRRMKRLAMGLM
ncbi:hypothetical protein Goshw_018327, partial [Gossypium schwendimanii]|nr:hypothetical protein [Gossypium schwendimanii]